MSDIRTLFSNPKKRLKVISDGEIAASSAPPASTSNLRHNPSNDLESSPEFDDELPEYVIDVEDDHQEQGGDLINQVSLNTFKHSK